MTITQYEPNVIRYTSSYIENNYEEIVLWNIFANILVWYLDELIFYFHNQQFIFIFFFLCYPMFYSKNQNTNNIVKYMNLYVSNKKFNIIRRVDLNLIYVPIEYFTLK